MSNGPGSASRQSDAIVIGGGFYGAMIALELANICDRVVLVEQERDILMRASTINQARVHGGYHYPRALLTAQSSRRNFTRFVEEFSFAISDGVRHLYAIAHASAVSANQFQVFCGKIGAPVRQLSGREASLFDPALIEAVFEVDEHVFDGRILADALRARLKDAGVVLRLGQAAHVEGHDASGVRVALADGEQLSAPHVFNCTYTALPSIGVDLRAPIKHELAEIVLIEPPAALQGMAVTVMDGPFFSVTPYPPVQLYALTHVRYTPHGAWFDAADAPPAPMHSNRAAMLRDAARYLPCLNTGAVRTSVFEIKAVLRQNEMDDGRPILIERATDVPGVTSILGAKIDNIYDALDFVRGQSWNDAR